MITCPVRNLKIFALLLVLTHPHIAGAADAEEEYICEAKQSSNNELAVLSKSCPIGKGLWGRVPNEDSGLFWIQCGLFPKSISLQQAKGLYSKISTDVWMKPEDKGYRCLIGPYKRFTLAQKELKQVKTLKTYRQAFIRSVGGSGSEPQAIKKPIEKPLPPKVTKNRPKPVPPKTVTKLKPKMVTDNAMENASSGAVVIRREAKIADTIFAVPFLMEGNEQYYMEHGIGWNRLNYERAKQVCESQSMRLVDETEWKALIESTVMTKKQWPIHVPYWGAGKKGLFTSGKITQLTGTSLLNVVCVK